MAKQERVGTRSVAKAALVAGGVIVALVSVLFWLGSVAARLLGAPTTLALPPAVRLLGWIALAAGAALGLWLFRYRSPATMIVSTYVTFVKMFSRAQIASLEGRTEPLVVNGPQKYVRHPLYPAATLIFLGCALVTNSTSSLFGVGCVVLWFVLVQIPFEETELRAIFGDPYVRYCREVPMLIPFMKRPRT
ncbi:MAG: isoprenylcysteine carboxylmethyltransferase family protein [Chloroflexota bacterium]|nr:isoprenylcysteine carboxylmethyltransferase family protein [Chloroflexota bacterium]